MRSGRMDSVVTLRRGTFLDASALVAVLDRRDQHHEHAQGVLLKESAKVGVLITNPAVLAEAMVRIKGRKALSGVRLSEFRTICESLGAAKPFSIMPEELEILESAYQLAAKYADQRASFVDCFVYAHAKALGSPGSGRIGWLAPQHLFRCYPYGPHMGK